ncbi:hypothetical protein MNBD_GAMMA12-409 [hydrothermal vent metagenome]|uniref:TIGR04219 family outer membrane beta-barrel protein n=1 Tax=hydrothermal vent metagenome TaxID=652676 RepID=A0A3B0YV10_9ZZZZ
MKALLLKIFTSFSLMLLLFNPAISAKAAIKLGFAAWNHEPSGSVRYQGSNSDAESDLRLSDKTEGFFWLAIEQPIPGIPNFKLTHTRLANSGAGVLTNSVTFGGNTFNAAENINTSLDLNQTDLTMYWRLGTKSTHFNLGLTLKYLDGNASILSTTTTQSRNVDFEVVLPLLYGGLNIKLPFSGLSVIAEGNVITYRSHSYSDILFSVKYESKAKIGIQAGYRRMQLDLDDLDGVSSDLEFSGPFFALSLNF